MLNGRALSLVLCTVSSNPLGTGQGIAHFQQKIKGVNKLGQAVGGQGQYDLIIRSGLDLPGQQIGKRGPQWDNRSR